MEYKCECCNYITIKRFNYNKHVLSNKHKLIAGLNPSVIATKVAKSSKMECTYCKQTYKSNLEHVVQCKKIYDLTEIVRIMNDRLEQQQTQMNQQKLQIEHIISEIF